MTDRAVDSLSGPELREMFAAATAWLERHVDQVNAVNVFPVPDGDTGTNMFLTMRSVMEDAGRCPEPGAGAMLAAMSHGALMGARGNSGVILSQIVRGIAAAADGVDALTADVFATGLEQGATAAYRAVTKPTEGTILTVIRDTSDAVRGYVSASDAELTSALQTAVDAARESVTRTPTLLPVLAEAGVVDAGGLGLSVLLDGMLHHVKGEPMDVPADADAVEPGWLAATGVRHRTEESLYGYCTEALIAGSALDVDSILGRITELGDSVIVVGDEQLVRVHVHTDDPGAALTCGTSVGSLVQVKVDNIRRQAERFVEEHVEKGAPRADFGDVSTVAVVAGEGMAAVFKSVGCRTVVAGGPTMNPSTRDILDAVEACPSDDVIVLPNDKNVILAARQAIELTQKRMRVVATRSMPQGIAALLALKPEDDLEANVAAMEEARHAVRTVEVTRAVRSTTISGVRVDEGQTIAVVDDELTLAVPTPEEAVVQALDSLTGEATSLITLYYGAETTVACADALAGDLRRRFPGHEVEVHFGGQPDYDYIVSLE